MFNIYEELPRNNDQVEEHIVALRKMSTNVEQKELFAHLYDSLSILDSKTSSLLSFNSIILAIYAIFIVSADSVSQIVPMIIVMISLLVSSISLLNVIWIHWSTTEQLNNTTEHIKVLLQVRKSRTITYRIAWYFSVFALVSLIIFLILQVFVMKAF